mmetsp:Transcript_73611/g.186675  ORF Transcript_73611/g.186675 Transcript_73611/m.186675 type:complete len:208 (-) Transcript_73611:552-1175(-)
MSPAEGAQPHAGPSPPTLRRPGAELDAVGRGESEPRGPRTRQPRTGGRLAIGRGGRAGQAPVHQYDVLVGGRARQPAVRQRKVHLVEVVHIQGLQIGPPCRTGHGDETVVGALHAVDVHVSGEHLRRGPRPRAPVATHRQVLHLWCIDHLDIERCGGLDGQGAATVRHLRKELEWQNLHHSGQPGVVTEPQQNICHRRTAVRRGDGE